MKKILLALIVISTLVSCGKNGANKVNLGNQTTGATSPVSTVNTNPAFQTLAQAISSNSFTVNGYYNYYTEYTFGTVTNTCVTKDGWFGIDYQSCSTSSSDTKVLYHGQIDVAAKQAELNAILSATVMFEQYNTFYFKLRTSDNRTYHIRTDIPIQANPVYNLNNADGKAIQLISIK